MTTPCMRSAGLYAVAERDGLYAALDLAITVIGFDLKRMIEFGPDYNQAVRDVYEAGIAVLTTRATMINDLFERADELGVEAPVSPWRPIDENTPKHGNYARVWVEEGLLYCPDNGEATHWMPLEPPRDEPKTARVRVSGDLEKLLEAVHEQEGKLMLLRHAIERRIADIYINESP